MTDRIFSGDKSNDMWRLINRLSKEKSYKKRKKFARRVMIALYVMGCKCQELETVVRRIDIELGMLKARVKADTETT